jgi:hypothetical protein
MALLSPLPPMRRGLGLNIKILLYRSGSQTSLDTIDKSHSAVDLNNDYPDDSNVILDDDLLDGDTNDYASDDDTVQRRNYKDDSGYNQTGVDDRDQKQQQPPLDTSDKDNATKDDVNTRMAGKDDDKDMDFAVDDDNYDVVNDDDDDDDGINIDSGFLKDSQGKEVKLPEPATTTTTSR